MGIKQNILVTGSNGQLGSCLRKIHKNYKNYNFLFKDKSKMDISNFEEVENTLLNNSVDLVINCAAFTNVEEIEKGINKADLINNKSVENLSRLCNIYGIQLIHISTDYVFDGKKKSNYFEDDLTNPINFYGLTKLNGEKSMIKNNPNKSIIIRTSWLYSTKQNNFAKKILNKLSTVDEISVVTNEIGSPTNANDLALTILNIIPKLDNKKVEIYNYANQGFCSRFDFAKKIKSTTNYKTKIIPISSNSSLVNRPEFSVLNTQKIQNKFKLSIPSWENSLVHFLKNN